MPLFAGARRCLFAIPAIILGFVFFFEPEGRGFDSLPAHHIFRIVTGFLRLGFLHRSRIEPFRAISNCSRTPQRRDHSLLLAWHAHTPAVSAPGQHDPVDRPPTGLTFQHEEPPVQTCIAKGALEGLVMPVLPRTTRLNEADADPSIFDPLLYLL